MQWDSISKKNIGREISNARFWKAPLSRQAEEFGAEILGQELEIPLLPSKNKTKKQNIKKNPTIKNKTKPISIHSLSTCAQPSLLEFIFQNLLGKAEIKAFQTYLGSPNWWLKPENILEQDWAGESG